MARTPEGKVRDHLKKKVEALGGEIRAVKWLQRNGAPDVLALLPPYVKIPISGMTVERGPQQHPLIETKAKNGVPEPHQLREHERLRKAGFVVLVLSTIEQIDEVFG